MIVYTDNKNLARKYFSENKWYNCNIGYQNKEIRPLLKELFANDDIFITEINLNQKSFNDLWQYGFIVNSAKSSQYDILIKLSQEINLPDGILCFADTGNNFHGFHNRSWSADTGNIHLSAFLKPNKAIKNFSSGFLVLSAISVVQTIDDIPKLKDKASIKWVNDILIDGSKVSGVLAHTHAQGEIIKDVVLGIGVNVHNKPDIEPSIFVPSATCLKDFIEINDNQFALIIENLLKNLMNNYNTILENRYSELLEYYIKKSMIIGEKVSIWSDKYNKNEKIASGIVKSMGKNLELYLENNPQAITNGRLSID